MSDSFQVMQDSYNNHYLKYSVHHLILDQEKHNYLQNFDQKDKLTSCLLKDKAHLTLSAETF